ncbi:S8 family serine peptidase [Aestuariibacter sp. GS-14]|uniref:S8 family serine peptidase n=1 Tax=Aestuariibacter sp. GS-14 TaxID=2590670 RepID=UPI0015E843FD|nr:S8 family serine peptidase [Aestuariibacter sp. GS-14]
MPGTQLHISRLTMALCLGLTATSYADAKVYQASAQPAQNSSQTQQTESSSEQRYIITFKDGITYEATAKSTMPSRKGKENRTSVMSKIQSAGGNTQKVMERHNMAVANLSEESLTALQNTANIEVAVDPQRTLYAQQTPYGYTNVQANQLVQSDLTARKVCIVDTGINLGHSDLPDENGGLTGEANNSAVGNWDNDGHGHGTHVAGIISALDNSIGVIGMYPGVSLHVVKVFDDTGTWAYASDLISALDQCQDAGANIVNLSLGGTSRSAAEEAAFQAFADSGMLIVAAAGNSGNTALSYPASYDAVVSVAAVNANNVKASYSQSNSQVELAAPGNAILSTYPDNTYAYMSGTSMATPHVSGAAALVWSFFPSCTAAEIRSALDASALDLGTSGKDNDYGYGIIQAADAYAYLNTNGCSGEVADSNDSTTDEADSNAEEETETGSFSEVLTGLSGSRNSWLYYNWTVPEGVSTLNVTTSGRSGEAELYVRFGSKPDSRSYNCQSRSRGSEQTCSFTAPEAGTWYVGISSKRGFSDLTLSFSYE